MKILLSVLFCFCGCVIMAQTAAEWCERASKSTDNNETILFADNALKIEPDNSWAFLLRGVGKLNLGRNHEALVDIDAAIRITPNYSSAYKNRGAANMNLGHYIAAVQDCDQAIFLDASSFAAYMNRGLAKKELGRYAESLADFSESIRLNPEYARAYLSKGQILSNLKRYQEALDEFNKGEKLDGTLTYHLNDKKIAQRVVQLGLKKEKTADEWLELARETNDNNTRIEYAENAIKLSPKNVEAFAARGVANANLGRNTEAIADYTEALKLDPKHVRSLNNRGLVQYNLMLYKEAIKDFSEAIRINPNFAEAYNNRGLAQYNLSFYSEAIKDYNEAIRINPKFTEVYNNRGVAKNSQGKHEEAVKDYNEAIRLDQNYKRAYINKGQSLCRLQKFAEALEMFENGEAIDNTITYHLADKKSAREALRLDKVAIEWYNKAFAATDNNLKIEYAGNAIKADPENATAYFLRAYAKASVKRNLEAVADYTEAIRLNPKYSSAFNNRGSILFDQGKFRDALRDYDQAIVYNQGNADTYNNRGICKNSLGDYEEAISDFDETLRLDPKHTRAYINKGRSLFNLKQYQPALDFFAQGEALDPKLTYHLEDKKKAEEALKTFAKPEKPAALLKRFALIIGNSAYDSGKSLEGRPNNDAKDIAARLESVGFKVFRYNDLRKQQDFLEVFRDFGQQARNADVALFFYAGHGVEVNGENYVIPTQAKLANRDDVDYEAFPVRRVLDEFAKLHTKSNIILLDACRENPFRSWSRGEDRGFKLIDITQAGLDNLFIGYATAPGSVAQNGSGRNGVFTSALLKFLYRGQRFDDIFQDTVNEVLIQTKNAQRPFQTSSLRTRLIF